MKTDVFDYPLPDELIAQSPAVPRESCRLLVLHRATGRIEHRRFTDILDYLNSGDLLVVNDTKVMPARLIGQKMGSSTVAELLLLQRQKPIEQDLDEKSQLWLALVRPGRKLKPGNRISFGRLEAEVVDWVEAEGKGQRIVRLETTDNSSVNEALLELGKLPLPPYIKDYKGDTSLYQTVYAQQQNSAAAPTAGLHFSEELLQEAQDKGVELARVCLEIGLDTFRKVEEEDIENHRIHSEFFQVSAEAVAAYRDARRRGGRVFAVGTTAVRSLESAADEAGSLREVEREQTRLYITPGYEYKAVDALITNFHTPRSTLLMLVAAFAGYDEMMKAYELAMKNEYRFLSFGDAMLII